MSYFDGPARKYYTMPYVKGGETPGAERARIFNKDTGEELKHWSILECNAKEGWLVRYLKGPDGEYILKDGAIATQRVKGYFEIRLYREVK